MRFREELHFPGRFVDSMEVWGERDFGCAKVSFIELVEHDWYNRKASKRILGEIDLAKSQMRG